MPITDSSKVNKSVLYQNIREEVDHESGELKRETTEQLIRYPAEPAYIKVYIDNLCAIVKAPDSLKDVLFLILRKLDYDGYITLSTRYRREICKILTIKDGTLRNRLAALTKRGIIASCGGNEYQANPNLFARGEWKTIIEQRREFEMRIRYKPNGENTIETSAV